MEGLVEGFEIHGCLVGEKRGGKGSGEGLQILQNTASLNSPKLEILLEILLEIFRIEHYKRNNLSLLPTILGVEELVI